MNIVHYVFAEGLNIVFKPTAADHLAKILNLMEGHDDVDHDKFVVRWAQDHFHVSSRNIHVGNIPGIFTLEYDQDGNLVFTNLDHQYGFNVPRKFIFDLDGLVDHIEYIE